MNTILNIEVDQSNKIFLTRQKTDLKVDLASIIEDDWWGWSFLNG